MKHFGVLVENYSLSMNYSYTHWTGEFPYLSRYHYISIRNQYLGLHATYCFLYHLHLVKLAWRMCNLKESHTGFYTLLGRKKTPSNVYEGVSNKWIIGILSPSLRDIFKLLVKVWSFVWLKPNTCPATVPLSKIDSLIPCLLLVSCWPWP